MSTTLLKNLFIAGSLVGINLLSYAQQMEGDVPDSIKKMVEKGEAEFVMVEKSAEFPGGMGAFYKYIAKNLKYPKKGNGLKGRVYVEFVINQDGSIDPVSVRCPSREELSKFGSLPTGDLLSQEEFITEAKRLIKESPHWIPGSQKGKPVKQRYTLPIIFRP